MKSYQFPTKYNRPINLPEKPTPSTIRPRRNSRFLGILMQAITLILIILISGLAVYYVVFKLGIFNISNVQVTGAKVFVNSTDILELSKTRSYGKNFFTFSADDLKNSLVKDFQGAKLISVSKKLPNTVLINVVERTPLALVSNKKNPEYFMVDEDGYVLGIVDSSKTNLPKILYEGDISVGYFLNREALAIYFQVLAASDVEKLKSSSMSLHSDYLSMFVDDSIEVLISADKDVNKTMKVVAQLITQIKTEGKNLKKIDLRFDKVIVSYR